MVIKTQMHLTLVWYVGFHVQKTKENMNYKKYNERGITVKIHINHDGVRCIGPSRLFYHDDLKKLHCPPFKWTSKSLLWYPFWCVESISVTCPAAKFFCFTANGAKFCMHDMYIYYH